MEGTTTGLGGWGDRKAADAVGNDQLQSVELSDGTVVARTAVFVRPRSVPNAGLLTGLGCAVEENGWVVNDPVGRTSVAGVWVAGQRRRSPRPGHHRCGQGSAAAIALNADLVDEDVEHALPITAPATRHGQPDQGNAPRRSH